MISLCLIARFKNERHIMFEFIHHYLEEGVDCFILIDDNSNDNYLHHNRDWMFDLIDKEKIIIVKGNHNSQANDYDRFLSKVKMFDWIIACDMDEFFYSVSPNTTIKSVLNSELSSYDCIQVPWKMFTHHSYNQPKSVIKDNLYTHSCKTDPTSQSKGYKNIIRTTVIKSIGIHSCKLESSAKRLYLEDCHNQIIQNNHYRTQSEEFLRGVKEIRGGGVHLNKYRHFDRHKRNVYDLKCESLLNKRKGLVAQCVKKSQVKPEIYKESSFYLENNNNLHDKHVLKIL